MPILTGSALTASANLPPRADVANVNGAFGFMKVHPIILDQF
jgi:hypothetical protein